MSSGIASFFECRSCVSTGQRSRLHVGLTNELTLRVWCANCDRLVADLELAHPMPLRCDVCGGPMTKEHRH